MSPSPVRSRTGSGSGGEQTKASGRGSICIASEGGKRPSGISRYPSRPLSQCLHLSGSATRDPPFENRRLEGSEAGIQIGGHRGSADRDGHPHPPENFRKVDLRGPWARPRPDQLAGVENHNLKDHQMKAKRRRHDTAFKARVGLEALKGQKTTQQIAAEYDVHPTQVSEWKKTLVGVPAQVALTPESTLGSQFRPKQACA